jgi:hypothetical protein
MELFFIVVADDILDNDKRVIIGIGTTKEQAYADAQSTCGYDTHIMQRCTKELYDECLEYAQGPYPVDFRESINGISDIR